MDATLRYLFKAMIAEAGFFMVFLTHLAARCNANRARAALGAGLVFLAVLAGAAYFEFGWLRYGRYMNPHDVYHYYIGAKYSDELEYVNLYRCSLIADMEMKRVYTKSTIRNLDDHSFESTRGVLQNAGQYKESFKPERWKEFKKDIRYFQSIVPASKWNTMLRDKGYNATPIWNMVARFLANHYPTSDPAAMRFLTYIDLFLLFIMFCLVYRAFGVETLLFALVFYGINFMMSFVHIKGAFMRLDWVTMLVMATCLLKIRWYKTAGGLMAYAGLARIFPLVFAFGIGAKFLWDVLRRRRLDQRYLGFFLTFAAVAVVLVGISISVDGGTETWKTFLHKIGVHNAELSTTRVGFKYVFLNTHGFGNSSFVGKLEDFERLRYVWLGIQAVMLGVCFFAVRKLEDYETIPFSFVPAFFLAAPTFYYYVMLVIPFFLFAPKIEELPRAVGLAAMFAMTFAFYILHRWWSLGMTLSFMLSWILLVFALGMILTGFIAPPVAHAAPPPVEQAPPPRKRRRWFVFACLAAVATGAVGLAGLFYQHGKSSLPEASTEEGVELVFTGDVMLARNVAKVVEEKGGDYAWPFRKVAPLLRGADAAFCNLENPVSGRGDPIDKKYLFNADPKCVKGLVSAGFDVVSLANNHILDYGMQGLEDTQRHLAAAGIASVGLSTEGQPQEPAIIEADGLKVGFLAYADPKGRYSYERSMYDFDVRPAEGLKTVIDQDIQSLKGKADIIVVSMHWGVEYTFEPNERQIELGRFIIEQGASIVAGHHPHVQQEPELYNGGLIIYSMGNFVFDQHTRPPTRISRLYRAVVDENGLKVAEYLPLRIETGWQPTPQADAFVTITGAGALSP